MIYVEGVDFMTPAELAEADDHARRRRSARQRDLVALRLASPLRPVAGRTADVDGLALFDVVRQPSLF